MSRILSRKPLALALLIALSSALEAQNNSPKLDVHIAQISSEEVEARVRHFSLKDPERESILKDQFQEVGCRDQNLTEQPVKHQKLPNLICVLPGDSDSEIIVGAHFDHASEGTGVVDNWSGAVMLVSLFQALSSQPRRHRFVFIAFTAEETGLVGSDFYAKQLSPEQIAKIQAMINLDSLGLGPTNIWLRHSDHHLGDILYGVSKTIGLPLGVVDADQGADEDSSSFSKLHVPTVMLHSLTQATFPILHSKRDNIDAMKMGDYYDSYRLISTYLGYLDSTLK